MSSLWLPLSTVSTLWEAVKERHLREQYQEASRGEWWWCSFDPQCCKPFKMVDVTVYVEELLKVMISIQVLDEMYNCGSLWK